jgi:hypothetical protein
MLEFTEFTPASHVFVTADFADLLPVGVTLSSVAVSCEVHPKSKVADPAAAALLDGAVQVTGTQASQFIKINTAIAGVDYVIRFLGTFSDDKIEPVDVLLPCRRFMSQ